MVSSAAIAFMIVTLILSILVPLLFLILLMRGRKGVFGAWIAGAIGFFVPQLIIRIPVLQLLGTQETVQRFSTEQPILFVFLLALTAGLFETLGRLLVLKALLVKRLSYMTGLAAGAGHGAIESIALIGMTYVNNLVLSLFINSGNLAVLMPENSAATEEIRSALLSVRPEMFLVAGLERIFTMMLHIALSVLLTWFILQRRSVRGFFLVLLIHFSVDFAVGVMQTQGLSVYWIEGVILGVAALSVLLVCWIKPLFKDQQGIPPDPAEQAVEEGY